MHAVPTLAALTEQQIVDLVTEALGPNAPFTLEQLSTMLFVLAIATVLLAMGLGYQAAKLDRRVRALEAALTAGVPTTGGARAVAGTSVAANAPAVTGTVKPASAKEVR